MIFAVASFDAKKEATIIKNDALQNAYFCSVTLVSKVLVILLTSKYSTMSCNLYIT